MENEFKTQSLQMAIHLQLCELSLRRIEKTNGDRRATFVFSDPNKIASKLSESFWDKSRQFPTIEVLSVMSEIKKRLYEEIGVNN